MINVKKEDELEDGEVVFKDLASALMAGKLCN
jgi:hypothetical protein